MNFNLSKTALNPRADSLFVPRTIDEITPEWLTAVLYQNGAKTESRVTSFESVDVGSGKGIAGEVYRLNLEIEGGSKPSSVVAKVSSRDEEILKFTAQAGWYEREVMFYTQLAPATGLRMPEIHFADYDPHSKQFILLMEDLSGFRALEQPDDASMADANAAIRYLALLHARWWEDEQLDSFPWLMRPSGQVEALGEQFAEVVDQFLEVGEPFLPEGVADIAKRLASKPLDASRFQVPPTTLIHTDFKLGNLFIDDARSGEDSILAVDWQTAGVMKPSIDVATFLISVFSPPTRLANEQQWIAEYHQTLVDHGVEGYSLEDLLTEIRITYLVMLMVAGRAVVKGMIDPQGNLDPRVKHLCERNQALVDWDCGELLR